MLVTKDISLGHTCMWSRCRFILKQQTVNIKRNDSEKLTHRFKTESKYDLFKPATHWTDHWENPDVFSQTENFLVWLGMKIHCRPACLDVLLPKNCRILQDGTRQILESLLYQPIEKKHECSPVQPAYWARKQPTKNLGFPKKLFAGVLQDLLV